METKQRTKAGERKQGGEMKGEKTGERRKREKEGKEGKEERQEERKWRGTIFSKEV